MDVYIREQMRKVGLLLISNNPEEYTLKSGAKTNIYINLKDLIKFPYLLSAITVEMSAMINSTMNNTIAYQSWKDTVSLCGVPYGAIPLSTNLSIIMNLPQILVRKEGAKGYGTKKRIEGLIKGNSVIIIEDVVTTGTSIKETIQLLLEEGINVLAAYSIVHRGDKSTSRIIVDNTDSAYNTSFVPYHYLYHIEELVNQQSLSYYDNIMNKIQTKKTNIILSYDISINDNDEIDSYSNLLNLLNGIHNEIIGLKIHPEILCLNKDEIIKLKIICERLGLFLWIDRKYNDIGNTVIKQLEYYLECCNAISISPTGGIQNKLLVSDDYNHINKFILMEMSSANNTFDLNVRNTMLHQYLEILELNPKVKSSTAIICQDEELIKWLTSKKIVTIRPGINLDNHNDGLNQQYTHPNSIRYPSTMYVIGRGITSSPNPLESAREYKKSLYNNNYSNNSII